MDMEHDLYITADGRSVPLTMRGVQIKFAESGQSIDSGLLEYGDLRGPWQDGSTITFLRLGERRIGAIISRVNCTREEYWSMRARLIDNLRPNRWTGGPWARPEPGTLRKILPGGADYRDLFVFLDRLEIPAEEPTEVDVGRINFMATVEWRCADPLYYGPSSMASVGLAAAGGLRFPACFWLAAVRPATWPTPMPPYPTNRWLFGGQAYYGSVVLTNPGTWHAWPIVTATGPVTYLSVSNTTTNESISFVGSVPGGTTLTIDLSYGQKRAYDSNGIDYSGYLDGDVGEFHIACAPEAAGGQNLLNLTIAGGDAATVLTVAFRPPYIGI